MNSESKRFYMAVAQARDLALRGMPFRAAVERSALLHGIPALYVAFEAGQACTGSLLANVALLRDRMEEDRQRAKRKTEIEFEDE